MDTAFDAILLLELDGTILYWNHGAEQTYEWSREEAVGRVSRDLLKTEFPEPLEEIHRKLLLESCWTGDLVHTTRTGKVLIVSSRWSLKRDGDGRPEAFLEITRDITELRRESLEKARLAAIIESSPDAIYRNSPGGIIETWNPGAWKLYGYAPGEAIGQPISMLASNHRVAEQRELMRRVFAGEKLTGFDTVRLRKDGSTVDISLSLSPILDSRGVATGVACVARDVTGRKRLEQQIRELNATLERRIEERTRQLTESNRELESFSYSVSHDLRAPLRSIDGFSKLLLEESNAQLEETAKDRLRRIRTASGRMAELIDDLLDLSRLGRADMRLEPVGLSTLAEHIAHQLQRSQPERNVRFRIQPGLTVRGDWRLLRVMLENLLENAFKFSAGSDPADIEFGSTRSESEAVFFVRDNGVGFDMQYAGQLFAPFQRLHSRWQFEGTGIGLATVHRIVARHGGRIWAEAEPARGAAFYFTLGAGAEG